MFTLFYILIFFLEVYTALVIIFFLIQLLRKKKQPWIILFAELICIGLFFYLRFLIGEHKLIFIGKYNKGQDHWEAGLANIGTYTFNLAILMGIFLVLQMAFWMIYSKKARLINLKIDMSSFLDSSQETFKK